MVDSTTPGGEVDPRTLQLSPELVSQIAAVLEDTAGEVRRAPVRAPGAMSFGQSTIGLTLGRHSLMAHQVMQDALAELDAHLRMTGDLVREHAQRLQAVDDDAAVSVRPYQAGVEAVAAPLDPTTEWVAQ
ncbi:hypothetical protein G5V58_24290 [Nocardioides anomalus]|uniref:ESX-1 secretion-associated protein n=1 Tax=Nocardioides anomalus TaxID=2712223 RepID=A0A6G6WJE0_9ACTN|nr:hypothetical protein [Nocardioides anomalus]QIG45451.1 hypothetical protein G5V58_24290 [Nocardioides anomalus]